MSSISSHRVHLCSTLFDLFSCASIGDQRTLFHANMARLHLHTSSNLHLLKRQCLAWMRHTLSSYLNLWMTFRLAIRHLDIVVEEQPRQDHLDLVSSKEATRASVGSVAESQVSLIGSDELVARDIRCLAASAQLVGAETVELRSGGIKFAVEVDGCGWDFDHDTWGDVLPVAEGYAFEDAATEGC
jgi:hypothetical protein